jgi:Rhodanese-related sulfurtransferase
MNNNIKPESIYQLINKDYCFIDIRDQYQFKKLHIKNFINVPYTNIYQYQFPIQKSIVLICYSGEKAKRIADDLCQKGYRAYYIDGGFQAVININQSQYY